MPANRFSVSVSEAVEERIHYAMRAADASGPNPFAKRAAAWILEELARTPLEFGESRHELTSMRLKLRVAFVDPFVVRFAAHEDSHQVFILDFVHNTRP